MRSSEGWHEKKVAIKNGKLCFTLDNKIWVPGDSIFSDFKIGDTLEYSEQTISIFSKICNHLVQYDGVLLVRFPLINLHARLLWSLQLPGVYRMPPDGGLDLCTGVAFEHVLPNLKK